MKKVGSNVEVVMSIILLILFSICVFTLISTGNNTERRILEQNEIKNNARMATSYINTIIKQNDVTGKIAVKPNPKTNQNCLVINEMIDGQKMNNWIYYEDGYLKQSMTIDNSPPDYETSSKIAKIDGFDINKEGRKITIEISYYYDGELHSISKVVILRSK